MVTGWDCPFIAPVSQMLMALLCGNGVILSAAPEAQLIGREIERILTERGLPAGLVSLVNLPPDQVASMLIASAFSAAHAPREPWPLYRPRRE